MAFPLNSSLLNNRRLRAGLLAAPLVLFVAVTFLAPLAAMLVRSVHEPAVARALPQTLGALAQWDGRELPGEAVFRIAGSEFVALNERRALGSVATRVNRLESGMRSTLLGTARALAAEPPGDSWRQAMIAADPDWAEVSSWLALRRAGEAVTPRHYLNALDLDRGGAGEIVRQPEDRRIYVSLLLRTFAISTAITAICLLLAYPLAWLLAHARPRRARFLLLLVLVPFWTSLLVRTTSWIVLLQNQGVINDLLVALGILAEEQRLALIYNMTGTIIAMVHVLLPFMILPLYSIMRTIPERHMQAAASLGASHWQALRRVYWPQSLPGVAAGSLLVFILCIGFYITPALVGGRTGQLVSSMIAYHMEQSLNWGLAAALGGILLLLVALLYVIYDRLVGIEKLSLN
ncbi:MAG: ABC transporter permease [Gammaproteobacteria bacterium]|nr:ABC transporter permease [Gammaproteobacteria bacterium]